MRRVQCAFGVAVLRPADVLTSAATGGLVALDIGIGPPEPQGLVAPQPVGRGCVIGALSRFGSGVVSGCISTAPRMAYRACPGDGRLAERTPGWTESRKPPL